MRPLRAASDVSRSGKDLDLSRILKPDCFTFIAFLCFAESITRLDNNPKKVEPRKTEDKQSSKTEDN